jgi:hypothetical protein
LKNFLKAFVVLVLLCIGGLVLVATVSAKQSKFECSGTFIRGGREENRNLFIKLDEYKWWVLWTKSKGDVWLEMPPDEVAYYPGIDDPGGAKLYFHMADSAMNVRGSFLKLSKYISVSIANGFFNGQCKPLD